MNINELTIGQAKELAAMFGSTPASTKPHPFTGKTVVCALPHGFVFIGTLDSEMMLTDASNLRYWERRDGGLPELAAKGPLPGDKIDKLPGRVDVSRYLFMYETGEWK